MAREQLSKKKRFDVFKRDIFTCQYCGRTPPAAVLEVDHIVAVASGGSNVDHNLITSCFDCNRGKAAGTLAGVPINVAEKADLLAERLAQVRAYDRLLKKARSAADKQVDEIREIFSAAFPEWQLNDTVKPSIRRFLERLPFIEVADSMESACARKPREHAFKYFCGICWRKIKGD